MRFFHRLQTQLDVAFVLLAVIPLLIVSAFIGQRSYRLLQQDAELSLQDRAHYLTHHIESFITGQADMLHYVADTSALLDRPLGEVIGGLLALDDVYHEVALLDPTGQEVERFSRQEIVTASDYRDRSADPAFTAIVEAGQPVYYGPVEFDNGLREPLMTISIPVRDLRTDVIVNVLVVDFRFRAVWDLLGAERYLEGETAYLLDESGLVIAHRNPSIVLQGTVLPVPDETSGMLTSIDGEPALFARSDISVGGREFVLFTERTSAQALSLAQDLQVIIAVVLVIAVSVAGVLMVVVVSRIVQPINHLSAVAQRIEKGELGTRAEVHGYGELATLANAFNTMSAKLEQSIDDLRDSQRRYKLLSDLTFEGVVLHQDGRILDINATMTKMFGYEREELINELGVELLFTPESHERIRQNINERLPEPYEVTGRRKDGSLFPVEIEARQVDEHLRVASLRDITYRKQAEQALRESEEKYRELVEHSYQGIAIVQGDPLRLRFVSQPMQTITGYTPEELLNFDERQIVNLIHLDDQEICFQELQKLLDGQNLIRKLRYRLIQRDGTLCHVEFFGSRIEYEGQPAAQTVFLDVTQQVEVERLRVRIQKEQQQNALIQQIVSMLSHDLRTPLAVISSSRDLLDLYHDRISEEQRKEKLETIKRQVQFALEILEDTVNIARGNLEQTELQLQLVNLETLCQVSISEIREANHAAQSFQLQNPDHIQNVTVDEVLVSRILLNLLSNAIKYSPPTSTITLRLEQQRDGVVFHVADEGEGIPDEELPYIFQPFYRLSAHEQVQGTGLGLSIVKECVERYQGHIEVSSQVGQGTTFSVWLPLERQPATSPVTSSE